MSRAAGSVAMVLVVRDRGLLDEGAPARPSPRPLGLWRLRELRRLPAVLGAALRRLASWASVRGCVLLDHDWDESWPSARRVCRRCAHVETLAPGCGVRRGHRIRQRSSPP